MVLPDGAVSGGPARSDPRRGEIPMMRAKRLETWQRHENSYKDTTDQDYLIVVVLIKINLFRKREMAKVICISNSKGGVGKTTTSSSVRHPRWRPPR